MLEREQLTQAEARTGAKEQFDILRSGNANLPLRLILLKSFMGRVDPPIQSDQDFQTIFGVSKDDFDKAVQRAKGSAPAPEM